MSGASFSFIIPTYNRAYILARAIESILTQKGTHEVEIIVADDGSTDSTLELVRGFGRSEIIYLRQENTGPSAARNLGLVHATKEWIVYLDSDNFLLPDFLETLTRNLDSHPTASYVMVRARKTKELYENGVLIQSVEDPENDLESVTLPELCTQKSHYFDVNGFAHKRQFFMDGIAWDKNIKRLEDWEFLMQLAEVDPAGFLYISQPIVHYYMRLGGTDGIISQSIPSDWIDAFEYVYQKHKNDKLMVGQTWYPSRIEKYRLKQEKFEKVGERSYMGFFKNK